MGSIPTRENELFQFPHSDIRQTAALSHHSTRGATKNVPSPNGVSSHEISSASPGEVVI